jgi:hypothetical protein
MSQCDADILNPMTDQYTYTFDDDWDYEIRIWVETDKSLSEFEESLATIIAPVTLNNHEFSLGAINCKVLSVKEQPPNFLGVPNARYSLMIIVPVVTYIIWSLFDRQFALSLTVGIRRRFNCRYLVTADEEMLIMYSGTNLPIYINRKYPAWQSGELNQFLQGEKIIELEVNPKHSSRDRAI